MKKKKRIVRFTTFNRLDCLASMDRFVDIFLKEVHKSDPNLGGLIEVVKRAIPNRIGPESLGLSVRFYSDTLSDFHHIENALKRTMHQRFGLPVFLKCRLITAKKPKNIISVKFGSRSYASDVPLTSLHQHGHRMAHRAHHN